MKRQPTEWEKIFAKEATNKELISKNIPTTYTAQKKKLKKDNPSKNGQKI